MGMGIGMVHHLMPGVVERLHRLRVFIHPVAHDKEGCLDLIFAQNIDQHLGVLVPPG